VNSRQVAHCIEAHTPKIKWKRGKRGEIVWEEWNQQALPEEIN
jgi:hypothetical protein